MLCRQPGCLNRTGFINFTPQDFSLHQSESFSSHRTLLVSSDVCNLTLRSQKCLDCHMKSGVCHLYTICPVCNSTVAKRAMSNHLCLRRRCTVCSSYYEIEHEASRNQSTRHQCFVQRPNRKREKVNSSSEEKSTTIPQTVDDEEFFDNCDSYSLNGTRSQSVTESSKQHEPQHSKLRKVSESFNLNGPNLEQPKVPDECVWVFDIETNQSCNNEGGHKPLLPDAESLTGQQEVHLGYDCIQNFCDKLFNDSSRVRKEEFVAHFGSGFDFLPILEWLYQQHKFIPKILLRGNKVVSMKVGNKRFIDSYLFIHIPLSSFAKIFGLTEQRKGYFPHFLTSKEALSYDANTECSPMHSFLTCSKGLNCRLRQTIAKDCFHCRNVLNSTTNNSNEPKLTTSFALLAGQFPPPCLFGVNSMKKSIDVEKFLSWHHEQSKWFFENSLVYDFKKELVEYCDSDVKMDVKLLKNGFLEYRRLMMEICSDIDPFQVACTAASACNFIYRQLFMPEDSIAIIPVTGYSGREKTSFPVSQWLKWVELVARKSSSNHTVRLYRSGNGSRSAIGKEQKLGQFKVDGANVDGRKRLFQVGYYLSVCFRVFWLLLS